MIFHIYKSLVFVLNGEQFYFLSVATSNNLAIMHNSNFPSYHHPKSSVKH